MAITAAKLLVQVDADTNKAVAGLTNVENRLRQLAGTGGSVGQVFAGVFGANLVQSAISGFRNLAAEGLQAFVTYERLGMSLQTLTAREALNSGQVKTMTEAYAKAGPKAQELLGWIQKLAIQSPFNQDDVAQAFRMAQAYGFTTDEAKRLTTALIDFTAGTGATGETMQRIALALGQIQAKGKLAGQEVLQLVNAGLSVDAILAKAFGKSTEEIVEMREKGLIPADQAIQAIVQSLEEDFGGAAARQAETFAGLVTSIEDIKEVGLREFFTGTFEAIRPYLSEFLGSFTSGEFQASVRAMGDSFGEFVGDMIAKVREVIDWWTNLDGSTQKLILSLGALVLFRGPILGLFADITAGARGVIGIIPGIVGGLNAIRTAIGAWQAGLTLTSALGVAGLSPLIISLGGVALAAAPLAGIWALWNAQIEANEKSIAAAHVSWESFFSSVSGNAQNVADQYVAQQERIYQATLKNNRLFDLVTTNKEKELGAWDELSQAVFRTSGTYDEYTEALDSAAKSQGLMIDDTGALVEAQTANMSATRVMIEGHYALSQAQYENLKAALALSAGLSDYVDGPLRSAIRQQAELTQGTDANAAALDAQKKAAAQAAEAAKKLAEDYAKAAEKAAQSALSAGLSGEITQAIADYQETLANLEPEHAKLQERLDQINVNGWIPSAESVADLAERLRDKNSAMSESEATEQAQIILAAAHKQEIEDLNKALGENETQQQEALAAMQAATAQMIYQQAAAGLDAQASLELARAMGLISEQDYNVASMLQNLRLEYDRNRDGAIEASEGASEYASKIALIDQAVQNLQEANMPLTVENIKQAIDDLNTVDVSTDDLLPDSEAWQTAKTSYDTFKTDSVAALSEVKTEAQTTATETKAAFDNTDWTGTGKQIGEKMRDGVKNSPFKEYMKTLLAEVKLMWTTEAGWNGVGLHIVNGIAQGVKNNTGMLADAMRAAIAAALQAAEDAAGIESPSKLFADMVGKPISQGIGMGIMQAAPVPALAAQTVVSRTAETVYQQPITIQARVDKDIDMYELAMTVASILRG